jgi:Protein of unknown function (DUF1499)
MKFSVVLLSGFAGCAVAYSPSPVTRRAAFQSLVASSAAAAIMASPSIANSLESCPRGSNNCIRTEWTPPVGSSKEAVVAGLKKALDAYPQDGQGGVDKGGWVIVEELSGGSGRVEFKSGIGNFAKFLNGGKPFVDDLTFEVADDGVVSVKSASRVGDSDFGVNQKRLEFLVVKLREAGWTAPNPVY